MKNYIFKDLSNQTLHGVKVNFRTGSNKRWLSLWNCTCTCGKEFVVVGSDLISGHTRSCGCLANKTTHNDSKTKFYKVWCGIKNRCLNQKSKSYKNYGGRGIKICERWLSYFNFKKDMYATYKCGLSIDRINVNGNYEKSNCRWSTHKEQNRNRRDNVFINTPNGKITIAEASEIYNIHSRTLYNRISRGWPENKLLINVKHKKPTIK